MKSYGVTIQMNLLSSIPSHGTIYLQGHPMDLFLKICVLQANFCWLGDLEKIVCLWKESVAGK